MRAPSVGLFSEIYHPVRNGVVASLDALAHALAERGCDVTFVTPHIAGKSEARGERDVLRLPSLPLPTRTAYRLTIPLLGATQRARVKTFSIVHAHSPFVTGALAAAVARRMRVPLVFTYHTQLEAYAHYVPFEPRATRYGARLVTRHFANLADAVIAPTEAMRARLLELGVRAPIAVVPTGIDVAAFASTRREECRSRFGIARDQRLVLCVGRLGREKNIERVIGAFARLNDARARLVLIGDGPHREPLRHEARVRGVAERVVFAGEYPRAELPATYAAADAFAFASRSETQGLVLVEALAAGLPVVAVDTPQTREVVRGGAELVADDEAALAAGLARVFAERDSPAALRRRERGEAAAAAYDSKRLGGAVLDLYRELLGLRGKASLPESAALAGAG